MAKEQGTLDHSLADMPVVEGRHPLYQKLQVVHVMTGALMQQTKGLQPGRFHEHDKGYTPEDQVQYVQSTYPCIVQALGELLVELGKVRLVRLGQP